MLAVFAAAHPAQAAPRAATPPGQASSRVIHPLSLERIADLEFGNVVVAGAGTVVINPNTNAVTTTGLVTVAGGNPHPAMFLGAARQSSVVIIRIPKQSVTITRAGGTQTMIVSDFTLQGQDKRTLAAQSSFDFKVGATLNVSANQVEGVYEGSFHVEVHYP